MAWQTFKQPVHTQLHTDRVALLKIGHGHRMCRDVVDEILWTAVLLCDLMLKGHKFFAWLWSRPLPFFHLIKMLNRNQRDICR